MKMKMKIKIKNTLHSRKKRSLKSRRSPPMPSVPIFNPKDFESNDGMLTTIWGPPMWHYLHTMSFNYPVEPKPDDKKHYREFINLLQYVLPCGKCRENLQKNFQKLPLNDEVMTNRHTFSRYMYDLHELINTMLKKKSKLTYEQVRERYEHFRSRCSKTASSRKTRRKSKSKSKSPKKEKGCTDPLTGEKSKCVLQIIPRSDPTESLTVDKQCEKVRILQ
jgi:hypothetical protein